MQDALPVVEEREGSYQETQLQEDSDLDGATLQSAESLEPDNAYADTQVAIEFSQVGYAAPSLGDEYADTQVDLNPTSRAPRMLGTETNSEILAPTSVPLIPDPRKAPSVLCATAAYADTQLDGALGERREVQEGTLDKPCCQESSLPLRDTGIADQSPPATLTVRQDVAMCTSQGQGGLASRQGQDADMDAAMNTSQGQEGLTTRQGQDADKDEASHERQIGQAVANESGQSHEHESASRGDRAGADPVVSTAWEPTRSAHVIVV